MEASRQGEGAEIVANHDLPREERRKHLEQMLLALDKTPQDQHQLEYDQLLTSGMAPAAAEKKYIRTEPTIPPLEQTDAPNAVVLEVDDPFLEEEKGPPRMIPGHELLGDTPVVFQPQNVMTMARVGQPLSEVASQADVFIRYQCKKGQCKTCAVNIDGKWVSACQTKIEPQAPGQHFGVRVRPVTEAQKREEKVAFFSPQSISDGFFNNAFGMFGFVKEGLAADDDFEVRMARERRIQELMEAKDKERRNQEEGRTSALKNLRGVKANSAAEKEGIHKKLGVPAAFGFVGFLIAIMQSANA
jgi:ferredoxin